MTYTSTIYESFSDINPAEWNAVADGAQDLAMDLRLLAAFEQTMAEQCRCWGVIFRDQGGAPVGTACLCLFEIDGMDVSPAWTRKALERIRRLWPRCLRFRLLFCGLPVPAGASHLRLAPGVDANAIVAALHAVMSDLAHQQGALLIAIKELNNGQCVDLATFSALGYIRGEVPPVYVLARRFANIEEYCRCQRGHYRRQTARSMRRFEQAGFSVEQWRGEEIACRYDREMHELYTAVWARAAYRLENLPAEFVRQVARRFGGQAYMTVLQRAGRKAAFVFSLLVKSNYYSLYCGLDYALNHEADLYFNLYYQDMDNAFRSGATEVHLGQTADVVKTRMGAEPQPLHFFIRARNRAAQMALRTVSRWAFPSFPAGETHHVFSGT